jgi:hypothetical protein
LRKKYVPASVKETAFNCPHCGALASQEWYSLYVDRVAHGRTPFIPNSGFENAVLNDPELDDNAKERLIDEAKNMKRGLVFFGERNGVYLQNEAGNLFASCCFNCRQIAVWVHDRLIFPPELHGIEPNEDIPPDILQDYEEARSILNLSPREAAALLRLAIQKLVKHLGEKGATLHFT